MLDKLVIRNFQKHKRLEINFDRITTITGSNSAGKTAVLRAIWWLCTNRPSGKTFIRQGANGNRVCRVSCDVDTHRISRERGTRNSYRLDGNVFVAFAGGVPPQVSAVLRTSELNYQRQLSPHFWLYLSPSQVSKELNSIVDFSLIDHSQAYITKLLRQEKSILQIAEQRLKQSRESKKELQWIVECDRELKTLERKNQTLRITRENASRLHRIVSDVSQIKQEIGSHQNASNAFLRCLAIAEKSLHLGERIKPLQNLIAKIESKRQSLIEVEREKNLVQEKLNKVRRCPICQSPM
jgi:DNA repair ATPase RecN